MSRVGRSSRFRYIYPMCTTDPFRAWRPDISPALHNPGTLNHYLMISGYIVVYRQGTMLWTDCTY